ncbi:hypothetical protein Patl1_36054 [Pistacia atlantica]|nr:hypothetical protein Patl1_36054 [Pistacia atlantica]
MMYGGLIDGNVAEFVFDNEGFVHKCLQITDAVVAAYILNATLVIPKLDQKSYRKDTSLLVILILNVFIYLGTDGTGHLFFFIGMCVQLTKFDYRLSNNLDSDLQKIRCRVNYHALIFTDSILEMGKLLVERMRMKSKHFIALHLRFESDMLAFSHSLDAIMVEERKKGQNLVLYESDGKVSNPDREQRNGRCPLTLRKLVDARGIGIWK